jgi:uncharacterized protein
LLYVNEGEALMKNYHIVDVIAVILLLIGGLNWGLVGLFKLDLVTAIFGMVLARIIFVVVGIAAVYRIVVWARSKSVK